MADFDLGKQIGPLPLGAWIGVVAGGLGLAWYVNRNSGASTSAPIEETSGTGLAAETGVGTGGQQFIYDPPQTGSQASYTTNDEWGRAAILYLISQGKNPATATTAVTKYLAEQTISAEQMAMISSAIGSLGPPPTLINTPVDTGTGNTGGNTGGGTSTVTLTAPKNLRTWGKGPSVLTVPLQWDAVAGASSYRVYRSGVAFNIGHSIDTKITIGGLRPGTSYTFHVRALDSKGKLGPSSASKTFKTKGK